MRRGNFLFTSESVSEGHPDKVCDRISDAIVDTYLARDPVARVAVETLSTTNRVVLAGEVRGPAEVTRELIEEDKVLFCAGTLDTTREPPSVKVDEIIPAEEVRAPSPALVCPRLPATTRRHRCHPCPSSVRGRALGVAR